MPNTTPRPKSTTQKGLGYDHQVHRDRLLLKHVDGKPCWWCGRKMFRDPSRNFDGKALNADHERSRAVYGTAGNAANRLLHDTCNKQRQDGSRDDQRPALTRTDTGSNELLGELFYFAWPAG
ncbi:hypothetical protein [Mycolicibacterium mageritense]|uniref:hypothetical protein n=1 Tax=Mycolicibacterium mageritense TaxID=53462 RepID=UPI001E3A40DA|nr:hypothetical protein [Mycolicibacterium mageritense]GJJ23715.1 hypothetical protein MTY414_73880 [Mycolicibacterium mageritense]